jgi:Domain of unknown function (DUF5011)/HYR domain
MQKISTLIKGTTTLVAVALIFSLSYTSSAQADASVCTTNTYTTTDNTVVVSTPPFAWTTISGSQWLWSEDPILGNPTIDAVRNFTKDFTISGTVMSATLELSADNTAQVTLNGTPIGATGNTLTEYSTVTTIPVDAGVFSSSNTLNFHVTNAGLSFLDPLNPSSNPAGFIYKLTVNSCTNPVVNTPPTITITGSNTVIIGDQFFSSTTGVTAFDTEDGDLTASIVITGGPVDTNIVGNTTLTYTVTDLGGLSTTTTRIITVSAAPDTTAPIFATAPNISTSTDTDNMVVVFANPTATDNIDGALASTSISCAPLSGSTFPVGTTLVTCTATDSALNVATTTFNVIVTKNVTTPVTPPSGGGSYSSGGSSGSYVSSFSPISLTVANSCPLITTFMKIAANNDRTEVIKLQTFLSTVEHFTVAVNGTFDVATDAAVKAFQAKYFTDTMGPWKTQAPSGYVYITTKKKINEIACNAAITLTPGESAIIAAHNAQIGQAPVASPVTPTITPTPAVGPTVNPSPAPATEVGATPTVDQTVGTNIDTNTANTASVVNTGIFQRFTHFLKNLF